MVKRRRETQEPGVGKAARNISWKGGWHSPVKGLSVWTFKPINTDPIEEHRKERRRETWQSCVTSIWFVYNAKIIIV